VRVCCVVRCCAVRCTPPALEAPARTRTRAQAHARHAFTQPPRPGTRARARMSATHCHDLALEVGGMQPRSSAPSPPWSRACRAAPPPDKALCGPACCTARQLRAAPCKVGGYRTPRCEHESLLACPGVPGSSPATCRMPAFLTQTALELPTYWSNLHIAHYWMEGFIIWESIVKTVEIVSVL